MDAFRYALKLKEIQAAKTQKARMEFIKEINTEMTESKRYLRCNTIGNLKVEERSRFFHLYTKAIAAYSGKVPIPEYILRNYKQLEDNFIRGLIAGKVTYEYVCEFLKYSGSIKFSVDINDLKCIDATIKNNTLPITFELDFNPSIKYAYLFNSTHEITGKLMELEEYKVQTGTFNLTACDQLLSKYYSELPPSSYAEIFNKLPLEMDLLNKAFNNIVERIHDEQT